MDVDLLYLAGCPNWHLARERLGEALMAAGSPDAKVHLRAVETEEQAHALRFPGSPTIRVNGQDLFPATAQTYGLACRMYPTPDGLSGTPTVDQIVHALRRH